jgi:hypothetical protein
VNGGARGDGYMDAYSAFLAHAPWAPGWGNHEYLEGDRGDRLANITAGLVSERRRVWEAEAEVSGAARDGAPSPSRIMYSVEVGLLHLLHLDLSPYWCRFSGCIGSDSCGFPDSYVRDASSDDPDIRYDFARFRADVLAFARADLAAVDRGRTPWVMVSVHYPLYETWDSAANRELDLSKPDFGARGLGFDGGGRRGAQPVPSKQLAVADFEPLLAEFGVDMFFAGHDHNYEVSAVFWCGTRLRGRWSDLWCCLCVFALGYSPDDLAGVPGQSRWAEVVQRASRAHPHSVRRRRPPGVYLVQARCA